MVAATVVAPSPPLVRMPGRSRGRAFGDLGRRQQLFELCCCQADPDPAIDHGRGRRYRACSAHRILDRGRQLAVARPRDAMTEDRRFQCHDRPPCGQSVGDGRADVDGHTLRRWKRMRAEARRWRAAAI